MTRLATRSTFSFALPFGLAIAAAVSFTACGSDGGSDDDDNGGEAGVGGSTGGSGGKGGASGGSGGGSGEGGEAQGASGGKGGNGGSGGSGKGGSGGGDPTGGTGGAGGSTGGAGGSGGTGGSGEPGSVPPELVGIWQETRASAGEYTNGYGENFEITSGFSVALHIRPNGSYYFAHLAAGVSLGCESVSYFEQSVGSAVLEGDVLTLHPTEHRLDRTDCQSSGAMDLPLDPIPFTITLEDAWHFYGGLRTYLMTVDGGPHPFELTLLHRPPLAEPPAPAQPDGFVLGTEGPFVELQGLWPAQAGTDTGFFDPATGEAYLPELNGSRHQWIRFVDDAYETAVALQTINDEGACKADVIYYEQGVGLFQVTEDVNGQGVHFVGHVRLESTAARLIVNVRECGEDDAVFEYDLPPQLSYYRFIYFSEGAPPERLELLCEFPLSEWQSLLCDGGGSGFIPAE